MDKSTDSLTVSPEALKSLVNKLENALDKLSNTRTKDKEKRLILAECENNLVKIEHWNSILNSLRILQKNAERCGNKGMILVSDVVIESVCAQNDFMEYSGQFVKPKGKELDILIGIFSKFNNKLHEIGYNYKGLDSMIKITMSSLEIFNWIFNDCNCDEIVGNYYYQNEMFINKIRRSCGEEEKEWLGTFKELMSAIVNYVSLEFKKGLDWDKNGDSDIFNLILKIGSTYRKYFKNSSNNDVVTYEEKEINKNINKIHEEIMKGDIKSQLKPIKNLSLNLSGQNAQKEVCGLVKENKSINSFFAYSSSESGITDSSDKKTPLKKKPVLGFGKRDNYLEKGNIILFENFNGLVKYIKSELLNTETFLRLTNCQNSAFKIEKKINRISVINSENVKIICGGLVSHIELINCSKVKIQSDGCINMATIDGCEEITLYLEEKTGHIPINYTHSNGIYLKLLKDGKYINYFVPQQFIYKVGENMKSEVEVSKIYA